MRHAIPLIATASLLLTACSTHESKPLDAGQQMSARGENISARGAAWTSGQNDMKNGRKLVAQSTGRVADAEKKLKRANEAVLKAELQIEAANAEKMDGERLISEGNAQMQKAEAAYVEMRNGPPVITPN